MRAPQVYEIELDGQLIDARSARQFFRETSEQLDLSERQVEAGELALSELVTNAIQYAGGLITVRAWRDRELLYLEVIDSNPQTPRMAKPGPDGTDTGGLPIVAAVAHEWGWDDDPNGHGKRVWLTLA